MNLAIPCVKCGNVVAVPEQLTGRIVRCLKCGQIQRIPMLRVKSGNDKPQRASDVYPLAVDLPIAGVESLTSTPTSNPRVRKGKAKRVNSSGWLRLVQASVRDSSLLERETLFLVVLSAADLLVTYALLRRGPAFYESNPVAQWFFERWNIAGMALFKFSAMGLVVVIGEVVERHRPTWGRVLLLVSCVATAAVVVHGMRILFGHDDSGAPVP